MPYIDKSRRKALFNENSLDRNDSMIHCGELNYKITTLIMDYIRDHGLKYQTINDIDGALTQVGREFSRIIVVPYEDKKRKENGDVWNFDYGITEGKSVKNKKNKL